MSKTLCAIKDMKNENHKLNKKCCDYAKKNRKLASNYMISVSVNVALVLTLLIIIGVKIV